MLSITTLLVTATTALLLASQMVNGGNGRLIVLVLFGWLMPRWARDGLYQAEIQRQSGTPSCCCGPGWRRRPRCVPPVEDDS